MPFIGLSLIFSILAIVHVIKTGRSQLWIMVLLALPGLGVLAYLLVEVLPGMVQGRASRQVSSTVNKALTRGRTFEEAKRDYTLSKSVKSACDLADLHCERSEYAEAAGLYESALTGLNKTNPDIMHKLAFSRFSLQQYTAAKATLDELISANPDYKNQDAHLLYARTLAALNDIPGASEEYETLIGYYTGPEPAYRFGKLLQENGNQTRAASLFQDIVDKAAQSPKHYRSMHSEWIGKAKRAL